MHSFVSLSEAVLRKARFTKPQLASAHPYFNMPVCFVVWDAAWVNADVNTCHVSSGYRHCKKPARYLAEIMGGHSSHLAPITEQCWCTCSNSSWKTLGNFLQLSWQLKAILLHLRKPISHREAVGYWYRRTGNRCHTSPNTPLSSIRNIESPFQEAELFRQQTSNSEVAGKLSVLDIYQQSLKYITQRRS